MLYIIHSTYNEKLYQQIKSKGVPVEFTSSLVHHLLKDDDTVIVDILSHETELNFFIENHNLSCICMSDETRKQGNIMFVSKYQTINTIYSSIFDRENQVIAIIGGSDLFGKLHTDYQNCNFVDFTYNPDSDLSLIEILDECGTELLKKMRNSNNKILYPISNIMDLLNPPIKLIEPLINTLKKNRDTIVHIDHLKGPLDLMLLNLSDLIILVHENIDVSAKRIDSAIEQVVSPKKIVSLNASTKAYEQFRLSEHMLCEKEN